MTEAKTFKRRVRERMSKTGESYTAARAQVSKKKEQLARARSTNAERMSDAKLKAATGKTWDRWFAILDRWGAAKKSHTEIARFLVDEHEVPGWWAQTVTVWYERARGLRVKHQRADGVFSISVTKTIDAPLDDVADAFLEARKRTRWLGASMSLRTAQPGKGARFDWEDGSSRVNVWFTKKGPSKTSVAVEHTRLPGAVEAEAMKAMWRARLGELKTMLEG